MGARGQLRLSLDPELPFASRNLERLEEAFFLFLFIGLWWYSTYRWRLVGEHHPAACRMYCYFCKHYMFLVLGAWVLWVRFSQSRPVDVITVHGAEKHQ
ncbi:hypothetical protein DFH27DRAFT_289667 [Peziza echinospora]|nr:hypothetical protein DFH27DRAFT_289667 [Peziza echinospora]